ncbi:hypothetical protein COOONC_14240 [Cooperia oncophora]
MEMQSPAGEEEHELVAACLGKGGGLEDYKNNKVQVELFEKQGNRRREYITKARSSIENIRTFVQNDYWVIGTHRTELNTLRRDMDFAKAELKAAKDAQLVGIKNQLYNLAVTAFEEKLKQVSQIRLY